MQGHRMRVRLLTELKTLDIRPDSLLGRWGLGLAHSNLGRHDEAIRGLGRQEIAVASGHSSGCAEAG